MIRDLIFEKFCFKNIFCPAFFLKAGVFKFLRFEERFRLAALS